MRQFKNFIFLLTLLTLFSVNIFAEEEIAQIPIDEEIDNKYLVIVPFSSDLINDFETNYVNKMMLQVSTKQIDYQVILSKFKDFKATKSTIIKLSLKIEKKKNGKYEVKTLLVDTRKRIIINKILRIRVKREKLIRNIQIALELLFYPLEQKLKEKKEKIRSSSTEKPVIVIPPTDTSLLDFKQRILSMQAALAAKFKMIKDKKQKYKKKLRKGLDTKEEDEDSNDVTPVMLKNLAALVKARQKKKPFNAKNIVLSELGAGYTTQTINSIDLIETISTIQYLTFNFNRVYFLDLEKKNALEFNFGLGKTFSAVEEDYGNYMKLVSAYYRKLGAGTSFGSSIDYETMNFTNLPVVGQEQKAANNSLIFASFRIKSNFKILKKNITLTLVYGVPISTTSEYETIVNSDGFTGSKIEIALNFGHVYRSLGLHVEIDIMDLTATTLSRELTASNTALVAYGTYKF